MASVVVIKDALHTPANPATPTVGVVGADEARLSQAASWARSTTGVGARAGIVYAGVSNLLAGTATTAPSMTITVAPLHFVSSKAASEGVYVGSSPGVVTLDIAAAPGANSRIDAVYVMQRDAGSPTSPDALTQGEIGVVTGTAAVSPAQPQIPVGSDLIGLVTVGAGATATTNGSVTVATTCRWTAPLGSPIPVRNTSERAAITHYDGLLIDRQDMNYIERSSGSAWIPQVETYAGTEIAFKGANPPAGARKFRYSWKFTYTTNAFGAFLINFPVAFSGLVSLMFVPVDGSGIAIVDSANTTTAMGRGILYGNGSGTIYVGTVNIMFFAEGW